MQRKKPKPRGRSRFGFKYNWLPDLPDQRDFLFAAKVVAPRKLPASIDLRPKCSPVVNQGKIGSCTGNSLAGMLEYLQLQALNDKIDDKKQNRVLTPEQFEKISRLFIYYNERWIEGTTDHDGGAMLRDGIKALHQWGCCKETTWKYSAANVLKKPSAPAYKQALPHLISSYFRIESLQEMKTCLADGFPFVFGFSVYESFESPDVARSGIMPMPDSDERLLGGHAVMAAGYNDKAGGILVRNSWGTDWGQKGYFWMPYEYITHPRLAQDFWTIRK